MRLRQQMIVEPTDDIAQQIFFLLCQKDDQYADVLLTNVQYGIRKIGCWAQPIL